MNTPHDGRFDIITVSVNSTIQAIRTEPTFVIMDMNARPLMGLRQGEQASLFFIYSTFHTQW